MQRFEVTAEQVGEDDCRRARTYWNVAVAVELNGAGRACRQGQLKVMQSDASLDHRRCLHRHAIRLLVWRDGPQSSHCVAGYDDIRKPAAIREEDWSVGTSWDRVAATTADRVQSIAEFHRKRTIIQPVLPGLPDGLLVSAIDESNRLTSSDITCGQHEQGQPHANRLVFNYAGRPAFVCHLSSRPERVF